MSNRSPQAPANTPVNGTPSPSSSSEDWAQVYRETEPDLTEEEVQALVARKLRIEAAEAARKAEAAQKRQEAAQRLREYLTHPPATPDTIVAQRLFWDAEEDRLWAWVTQHAVLIPGEGMSPLPIGWLLASFHSSIQPQQVLQDVQDWLQAPRGNLILGGPVGCGKTFLGLSALKEMVRARYSAAYIESRALVYCSESEVQSLTGFDVVMVDDVGVETDQDGVSRQRLARLHSLINARRERQVPTIFTTNWSKLELAKHLGERTYSRLTNPSTFIELSGSDLRAKGY